MPNKPWLVKATNPKSDPTKREQKEEISEGQDAQSWRENPDPSASGPISSVDIINNWHLMITQAELGTKSGLH